MSYVTLLVPVDTRPATDARLALATALANRFDASLIGVAAEMWRVPVMTDPLDGGYATGVVIGLEQAQIEARLSQAEAKFKAATSAVKAGSEWRQAMQPPLTAAAAEACCADLIVMNHRVHDDGSSMSTVVPAALVLAAGRPVLIAPPEMTNLKLQTVLVAWKDVREARRAVVDALPILKVADAVVVAEVCPHDEERATEARLARVTAYLQRHGVRAASKISVEEKDVSAADQLLALAEDVRPDLIVAGAYGHARLQEWVFGGFTKALLAQRSRAVLLSH
ncbi:universal stress protein [Phenylobacterium soli]|nr:universal stress protein [Phenylobacterium soli]